VTALVTAPGDTNLSDATVETSGGVAGSTGNVVVSAEQSL